MNEHIPMWIRRRGKYDLVKFLKKIYLLLYNWVRNEIEFTPHKGIINIWSVSLATSYPRSIFPKMA